MRNIRLQSGYRGLPSAESESHSLGASSVGKGTKHATLESAFVRGETVQRQSLLAGEGYRWMMFSAVSIRGFIGDVFEKVVNEIPRYLIYISTRTFTVSILSSKLLAGVDSCEFPTAHSDPSLVLDAKAKRSLESSLLSVSSAARARHCKDTSILGVYVDINLLYWIALLTAGEP